MLDLLLIAQDAVPQAAAVAKGADLKWLAYGGFLSLVIVFLALDLGVFHREAHEVGIKEAMIWSVVWVACALLFAVFVYFAYENHWLGLGLNVPVLGSAGETATVPGGVAVKQYLTGYVVEKSLSMDNVFVIALIFSYFAIPNKYQHRVLFWGILGALVMRGIMIFIGSELVKQFDWILIVFGGFLVFTAMKMWLVESDVDPAKNPAVKLAKKLYPVSEKLDGQRFFTRVNGVRHMTPLMLALIMVEITDLIFAVDSIPAIFAITADPFIVFTSNIFAILGLRALYFALAALIRKFRFLKPALIVILAFVGVKLLLLATPPYLHLVGLGSKLEPFKAIKIDTSISLAVVLGMLALAVVASIMFPSKEGSGEAGGH
ncbi:MAG: TerC family protein [Planctomycetaceae bacterium]|jgi:tellurite resistance protein TerC|nr:TerC family protein [Phycisphaerales bacterium]MCE2653755.1 TerC family protein [Planctomycetaceae bacterium]